MEYVIFFYNTIDNTIDNNKCNTFDGILEYSEVIAHLNQYLYYQILIKMGNDFRIFGLY